MLELIGDQAHPLCLGLPAVCLGIFKLQARFLELSSSPATLRSRDPPAHTPCIGNHSTKAASDRQQPQASSVSSHQPQLKGTRARTEHHSSSCRTAVSDSCSTLPCPALQIRMNVAACKQRKGKERKGKERKGKERARRAHPSRVSFASESRASSSASRPSSSKSSAYGSSPAQKTPFPPQHFKCLSQAYLGKDYSGTGYYLLML